MLSSLLSLSAGSAFADYTSGLRLFNAKNYTSSAPEFYSAFQNAKEKKSRLQAALGLATSLQRLGFSYAATEYFAMLVESGHAALFREGLEAYAAIDELTPLSRETIARLFKQDVELSGVGPAARGFFFYYAGREYFQRKLWRQAEELFKQVPPVSALFPKALFHLGIVSHLSGNATMSERYFDKALEVASTLRNSDWFREQVFLNLARLHYEKQDFVRAVEFYAKIPRDSENWLTAVLESAWAFFLMEKPNNTLGNIHTLHSPFFEKRFFPESFILQATSFLRLCRFDRVKTSVDEFDRRYGPVFNQLREVIGTAEKNPEFIYEIVRDYKMQKLEQYQEIGTVLDALSRTDLFKQGLATMEKLADEEKRLVTAPSSWPRPFADKLRSLLEQKQSRLVQDLGRSLQEQGQFYLRYLNELGAQAKLITAERLLGRIEALRQELQIHTTPKKENFIGGLQPLVLGQDLEYWPFEGEYWEDELGGYVYNIASKCRG